MSWENDVYEPAIPHDVVRQQMQRYQEEQAALANAARQRNANRTARQATMTPQERVLNNIKTRNHFKVRPYKLSAINRTRAELGYEAAVQGNISEANVQRKAANTISKSMRGHFGKKWLTERAARPPGTLGPNNTGGELYKLWEKQAAPRWNNATRKARKSRKSRKNRKSRK